MLYRTRVPGPPLSDSVQLLWLYQGEPRPHDKERLLPTGTMELVINLREDRMRVYDREHQDRFQSLPGSAVCGIHSQFFVIDTAEQDWVAGVHFKPGGTFPFFNLPGHELHNVHVPLEALWGNSAADLRSQLLEAGNPDAQFAVLERCLLAHARRPLKGHPAVGFALTEFHSVPHVRTIAEVTQQIGLSARRFIEVFSDEVGMNPKAFCRVRRFQRALAMVHGKRQVEWAGVAADCGYFDQAHFIHDFRAFSGLNPSAYFTQRTEHLNHVPILD